MESLKSVFDRWDTSNDGQICAAELKAVLETLYGMDDKPECIADKTVADAEADAGQYLLKLDKDGDHKVSWDEFKGLLAKGS